MSEPKISYHLLNLFYSAQLLDYSLFNLSFHHLKKALYNDGNWFFSNAASKATQIPNSFPEKGNYFLDLVTDNLKVADEKPRFKMIHVTTPHPEYKYNRYCELDDIKLNQEAMLEQSMCGIEKISELLNKLKQNEIYDNSLIIVTSDHGSRLSIYKSITDSLRTLN